MAETWWYFRGYNTKFRSAIVRTPTCGPILGVNLVDVSYRERLDALPEDAEDLSFGNSVYRIRFDERENKPIFGHKYWFFLQDAVENVPEYIVRWQNFIE